jgi:hypothetical protein
VKPWDIRAKEIQAPAGATDKNRAFIFCRPCRDLVGLWSLTHGFTVGYYLQRLRRFRKKINLDAVKVEV